MVKPDDCRNADARLLGRGTDTPVSLIDIEFGTPIKPHTRGCAYVNGVKIGRDVRYRRGRLLPDARGRQAGGCDAAEPGGHGWRIPARHRTEFQALGSRRLRASRLARKRCATHTCALASGELLGEDMLLGADFFPLAPHLRLQQPAQALLHLQRRPGLQPDDHAGKRARSAAALRSPRRKRRQPTHRRQRRPLAAQLRPTISTPQALARRGAASAGRHDYAHALDRPHARHRNGSRRAGLLLRARPRPICGNSQPELALADFGQAIRLKPDDVQVLMARAELRAARHEPRRGHRGRPEGRRPCRAGRIRDPRAARQPVSICGRYARRDSAVQRLDRRHTNARTSPCRGVLNSAAGHGRNGVRSWTARSRTATRRCDCGPTTPPFSTVAGSSTCAQGKYDQAIADYDASLKVHPNNPWVLYCRGIAKQRKGPPGAGQADIDAALAQQPRSLERAAKFGLTY